MKKVLCFILVYFLYLVPVFSYNIVSIGDSIPNGYMLSNEEDSFDNLFSETIDADLKEYSEIGLTSKDILDLLNSNDLDNDIKKADMIILTVGSNDLLDIVFEVELPGIDIDFYNNANITLNGDYVDILEVLENLNNFFVSEELTNMLEDAFLNFSNNWEQIINYIKTVNPDAQLVVNNLYNPFFNISVPLLDIDFSNASNLIDSYIQKMNNIILEESDDYQVIDTYNILRSNSLLNLNLIKLELDPHPNRRGHKKLFESYLKELTYKVTVDEDIYYVVKGESLKLEEPIKEGYTFKKWDKDLNNINSDMEVKPIFKKNINYGLIITISLVVLLISIIFIKIKKKA